MTRSATGGRYEGCGSVVASVEKRVEGDALRIGGRARFGVESSHTTEYDGGAPEGAESAGIRRPQNLI